MCDGQMQDAPLFVSPRTWKKVCIAFERIRYISQQVRKAGCFTGVQKSCTSPRGMQEFKQVWSNKYFWSEFVKIEGERREIKFFLKDEYQLQWIFFFFYERKLKNAIFTTVTNNFFTVFKTCDVKNNIPFQKGTRSTFLRYMSHESNNTIWG